MKTITKTRGEMSISPYDGESPDNLDENREKLIKAVISTLEPFQVEELAK